MPSSTTTGLLLSPTVHRVTSAGARAAATLIALAAWGGLAAGCLGVYGRTGSGGATAWIMSGYFTNTTALFVAILFTGLAVGLSSFTRPSALGAATLSILLVGIVQRLLLHGLKVRQGPDAVADALLHVALPILVPLFWLAFARKGALRARDPLIWAVYPLTYLGWALWRGATGSRYAYPFLDPAQGGWSIVLAHVVAITAGFLLVGWSIVRLDRRLAAASPAVTDR